MSSSAFWTRQHGWPDVFTHMRRQRCSLTAIRLLLSRPTIRRVRAVVVGQDGEPALADVPEPDGPGELVRVLACGLCGSDVEKLVAGPRRGRARPRGRRRDGGRAARRARPPRAPAGSASGAWRGTSRPASGSPRRRSAPAASPSACARRAGSTLPRHGRTGAGRWWSRSHASCAGRAGAPRAACSSSATASSGGSSARCSSGGGTRCSPSTSTRGARAARPDGPVDAAVLCGRGGVETALEARRAGRHAARLRRRGRRSRPRDVYRRELTVVGVALGGAPGTWRRRWRSSTSSRCRARRPAARALRRGPRALPPTRRAEGRLHPVRALRLHGPGDLRLEDVPDPVPGDGDVLLQVEVALTDGTDLKAYRRGHPVLLGPPPSPFGHEFCGIDVATGGGSSRPTRRRAARARPCERGQETLCENLFPLLNGAYAELLLVPERIAPPQPPPRACRARARGRRDGRAARVLPPRRRRRGRAPGDTVASSGSAPIGLMLCACVADAGGRPVGVGSREERRALASAFGAVAGGSRRRRRRDRGGGNRRGLGAGARARPARRHGARVRRAAARRARRGRPVPHPLRGGAARRRLPPHAASLPRGARVPRERRVPVRAPRHPRGRAGGRRGAVRRPAARLPEGGRRPSGLD